MNSEYFPYIVKVPGYTVSIKPGRTRIVAGPSNVPMPGGLSATAIEAALAQRVMELEIALRTIKDRINGEWDSPRLRAFGPLAIDTDADVLRIATTALGDGHAPDA